ncbi:MAG: hypothetical protein COZ43_09995 [Sphingomonadales bacterium CG_4_10_14_3_um_filter_58_15]|nr:hypothetical protein [Sphingomonadales bacterium]PIX65226.1 MAG: hypothetical protein COZ43_09995 [Sphingomonadales bacterium CG_4_10_14_3_um_filter_58_15]
MDRETLRPLALHNEGITHSFRASLPARISEVAREKRESETVEAAKAKGLGEDASLFLLSFMAFFTAFYTFIF